MNTILVEFFVKLCENHECKFEQSYWSSNQWVRSECKYYDDKSIIRLEPHDDELNLQKIFEINFKTYFVILTLIYDNQAIFVDLTFFSVYIDSILKSKSSVFEYLKMSAIIKCLFKLFGLIHNRNWILKPQIWINWYNNSL